MMRGMFKRKLKDFAEQQIEKSKTMTLLDRFKVNLKESALEYSDDEENHGEYGGGSGKSDHTLFSSMRTDKKLLTNEK